VHYLLAEKEKKMASSYALDLFKDPFFIGFNRELERFNSLSKVNNGAFPPYDLLKLDEDNYQLTLAVAGFTKKDLTVSIEDGSLWITGEITTITDAEVVHKGIAARKFTRIFELSEYMEVSTVELKDGMLNIRIVRNLPKEKQPKILTIK
jgi:molecular chaperone IbpA